MSRVWVVSGIVIMGTGLALAGFAYWLTGSGNCDAADLGRACLLGSLSLGAIGLALTVGGWMRAKRLAGGDDSGGGGTGSLRPQLAILAVLVVGLLLVNVFPPVPGPPVDILVRPTPAPGADPASFALASLAGLVRTDLSVGNGSGRALNDSGVAVHALATYAAGSTVRITRFNASNGTDGTAPNGTGAARNITLAAASAAAEAYLDEAYWRLGADASPRVCAKPGTSQWFTLERPGESVFAWRKANFAVEVQAPDRATRDALAGALSL